MSKLFVWDNEGEKCVEHPITIPTIEESIAKGREYEAITSAFIKQIKKMKELTLFTAYEAAIDGKLVYRYYWSLNKWVCSGRRLC